MLKISDEVIREANLLNINIQKIEPVLFASIISSIKKKYIKHNTKGMWLWERYINEESVCNKEGWRFIKEFVQETECILFFNDCDDNDAFIIGNGEELNAILSETSGFEFYVTNLETQYLISFNHHDCLSGCGTAKEWVSKMK